MKTLVFVRTYLGGASHLWQSELGNGKLVSGAGTREGRRGSLGGSANEVRHHAG